MSKETRKPFTVVRFGGRVGPDRAGDWFAVRAWGSREIACPEHTSLTAFGGSIGARREAQNLADALNAAWDLAHNGIQDPPEAFGKYGGTYLRWYRTEGNANGQRAADDLGAEQVFEGNARVAILRCASDAVAQIMQVHIRDAYRVHSTIVDR